MTTLSKQPNFPELGNLSDRAALRRYAGRGDPRAFEVIAARYHAMVLATCRRALKNSADAEDATQETFLKLSQQASSIRSNVAAWLHACAMGTSVDLARRAGATKRAERHPQAAASSAIEQSAEERAVWQEVEPLLDEALAALDERDRDLIVARFLAGRPQRELAKAAGVSDGTISRRIDRALAKLRTNLTARGLAVAGAVPLSAAMLSAVSPAAPAGAAATVAKIGLSGIAQGSSSAAISGKGALLISGAVAGITLAALVVAPALTRQSQSNQFVANATAANQDEPLGPERLNKKIGPFVVVSTSDRSFAERGVFIGERNLSIRHGTTLEGEQKKAILRMDRITPIPGDAGAVEIDTRVTEISPVGDPYSRFELGQRFTMTARFDEVGRLVLETPAEGPQLGRNEPRWFGTRPPMGWAEFARIPDDAGPHGILGPWAEAERIPVTITGREVRFGAENWTQNLYRIVEWTQMEGFSRSTRVGATPRSSAPGFVSSSDATKKGTASRTSRPRRIARTPGLVRSSTPRRTPCV